MAQEAKIYTLKVLDKLRTKLLDLTGRNNLISYRHTPRSQKQIRIVDEALEQLYLKFREENTVFRFKNVPEPELEYDDENNVEFETKLNELKAYDKEYLIDYEGLGEDPSEKAIFNLENKLRDRVRLLLNLSPVSRKINISVEDQAKKNNIEPSYELLTKSSSENHIDEYIQTLLYPEDLKRKLKNIYEFNNLNESETGVSTLFCALGFLEWYDSDSSEKKILSPLILLPIKIERALIKGEHDYKISQRDEDTLNNASLAEKLSSDFGIVLPEFTEDLPIVDFYKSCQEVIAKNKNWKIRTYATVGFFSFTKFLMYKDIKAENLDNVDIAESLVAKIIHGTERSGDTLFAEDYEIDKDESVRLRIPDLITDADSSQISAILDVLDGKNLVIEGPPGTGKSQTITNIIASCLSQGKKVLFLAEKNAALLVVKNRLDKAGVGDFCFELHSNKIQKTLVYKSLEKSLKLRAAGTNRESYLQIKEKTDKAKDELRKYVNALCQKNYLFKVPYQQLIWRKINIEKEIGQSNANVIQKFEPHLLTDAYSKNREILEKIQTKFQNLNAEEVKGGAWSFLNYKNITPFNTQEIIEDSLGINNELSDIEFANNLKSLENLSAVNIVEVLNILQHESFNSFDSSVINDVLKNDVPLCLFEEWLKTQKQLSQVQLDISLLYNGNLPDTNLSSLQNLKFVNEYYPKESVARLESLKEEVIQECLFNKKRHENISKTSQGRNLNLEEMRNLQKIVLAISNRRKTKIPFVADLISNEGIHDIVKLQSLYSELNGISKQVEYYFDPSILKIEGELLCRWKLKVAQSGFFSFLDFEYRKIKKELKLFFKHGFEKRKVANALEAVHQFLTKKNEAEQSLTLSRMVSLGYPVTTDNINDILKHYEFLFEAYIETNKILGEDSLSWFTLGENDIDKIYQDLSVLDNEWSRLNVVTFNSYSSKIEVIVKELSLLAENTSRNPAILKDLTICELFKLNDLMSFYCSLKNSEETILKDFNYLPLLNVKVLNDTVELLKNLHNIKNLKPLDVKNIDINSILNSSKDDILKLESRTKKLVSSIQKFSKNWHVEDDLILNLKLITLNLMFHECKLKHQLLRESIDYHFVKNNLNNDKVLSFVNSFENNKISYKYLLDGYEYFAICIEFKVFFQNNPFLMLGLGNDLNSLRQKFSSLDEELMKNYQLNLVNELARIPIEKGIGVGKVSDKTQLGFIQHQFSLKMRHAPIRLLLKKSAKAVQDIMPCFMMSPLTLAQYIPIGSLSFDVIIMDEASQLRPEDSIGALFRAKQVIIVGDPKQLPPTSFFDTNNSGLITDDEDDDGISAADIDHESILDMAINSFRPARRLKWHYRSKHQDLISYSNKKFYDGDLVVFPSPSQDHELFGLELVHVKDGIYENRRNIKEAEALLDWIQQFIVKYPDKSFGIVTMNQPQQELISDLFEKRLKHDPILEAYTKNREDTMEKVIIKNLENIQGDERDIILISTVYGREANSPQVKQRFGPINSKMGHRRLNVLFTRARYKNVVFSSLDSTDIIPTASSSEGVLVFKEFLNFAKTKIISDPKSLGEPDSDFEIFVMSELKRNNFEVVAQVGVSGYRIDIGVIDPNNNGRYLCGIECDGATYHSAKSVRDRDKIRQEILESLGWKIYRIWSTDWFGNKEHEVKKLIDYLRKIQ